MSVPAKFEACFRKIVQGDKKKTCQLVIGESEFKVQFELFLYQVSQNRDLNFQKIAKITSSDFFTKKHISNLTFFIDKNNAYTLIRVC